MRTDLYSEMYELESTYWWHKAKRHLVKSIITRMKIDTHNSKLLDVGCGTGKFLEEMNTWNSWGELIGLDGSDEALKFTKKRKVANVKKADLEKEIPLKDNSIDIITSLDVVEHIENDQHLVREFNRVLKPGGSLIITVPAHQWLWTYWDDILGHKRRHNQASVEALMKQANLKVEWISYFYSYLLPIACVFRLIKSKTNKENSSDFVALPDWINRLLISFAEAETALIKYTKVPFGLSVVCVARKES